MCNTVPFTFLYRVRAATDNDHVTVPSLPSAPAAFVSLHSSSLHPNRPNHLHHPNHPNLPDHPNHPALAADGLSSSCTKEHRREDPKEEDGAEEQA